MKIKSRHHLKASGTRKLVRMLSPFFEDPSALQKSSLEIVETDSGPDLIFVNGKPLFMKLDDQFFFTVRGAIEFPSQKRLVVVDSGAVSYLVNGADVMCPGIVAADPEISPGDLVVVVEEKYKKPLAIGKALMAGTEMEGSGKAVKSIHHVGDQIWKIGN
jgi:PUA-domain protein